MGGMTEAQRSKYRRTGRLLNIVGGGLLLVMWIPVWAGTPGDVWLSTIGLLIFLVGVGFTIRAEVGKAARHE